MPHEQQLHPLVITQIFNTVHSVAKFTKIVALNYFYNNNDLLKKKGEMFCMCGLNLALKFLFPDFLHLRRPR